MNKFREFTTSSGIKVICGRDAETNDAVVDQAEDNELLVHTEAAGSPFCNIKASERDISKQDIKETAIFCARYSREWKKNKRNTEVHIFTKKDMYKDKKMKAGTWGVRKLKRLVISKEDITKLENSK